MTHVISQINFKQAVSVCLLIIVFFNACTVVIPKWPDPYNLPEKIVGKQYIGTERRIFMRKGNEELFPVAPGTVFLKNKSSISGTIWVQTHYVRSIHSYVYPQVQVISRSWNEINPKNINEYFTKESVFDIDSIKMAIPLPDGISDSTTFVNSKEFSANMTIGKNEGFIKSRPMLWRRLLYNKSVSIYDDFSHGDGYESTDIIAIDIFGDSLFTISNSYFKRNIKEQALKFIQRRYGDTDAGFHSVTDMIRYILAKETELSKLKKARHNNLGSHQA